jgi:hypothetical protein
MLKGKMEFRIGNERHSRRHRARRFFLRRHRGRGYLRATA